MKKTDDCAPIIWFLLVLVSALVVLAVGYSAGTESLNKSKKSGATSAYAFDYARAVDECKKNKLLQLEKCLTKSIKILNEEVRAERDIVAQIEMAMWAKWMVFVSILMLAITSVSVVFLFKTLVATRKMTHFVIEKEKSEKTGSLYAEKAMLPFALSSLMSLCHFKIQQRIDTANIPSAKLSGSVPDDEYKEALSAIKMCLKFADEKSKARLANILMTAQIVVVRDQNKLPGKISTKEKDVANWGNVQKIVDWATLHALCSQAFGYARGQEATIPDYKIYQLVNQALELAFAFPDDYPDLKTKLEIEKDKNGFEFDFF